MQDLQFREAHSNDLSQLADLFDLYRVFYKQDSNLVGALHFIKQRLELQDSILLVAENSKTLLGFSQLYPSYSSVSMAPIWILDDLFVHEDCRGQGVAGGLLKAAQNFGKQSGAQFMTLQTGKDNSAAKGLYEKMGWKLNDEFLNFGFTF